MPRPLLVLALCAALALGVLPAAAADGDCRLIRGAATPDTSDDVTVCRQDTWIAEADSKVGNQASTIPTWDTTAPTASVASGAGGGSFGLAAASQNLGRHNPDYDATFEGTFTGNIDTLGATLYLFTTARTGTTTQAVSLQLTVDGKVLYATGGEADRTPLASGGNAVSVTRFTFTDLHAAMQKAGVALGDDVTHTVRLSVSNWFSVNDNVAYVYDTTEVPSGLVFNIESPVGATFKAS